MAAGIWLLQEIDTVKDFVFETLKNSNNLYVG
jgi:hypothetical protein